MNNSATKKYDAVLFILFLTFYALFTGYEIISNVVVGRGDDADSDGWKVVGFLAFLLVGTICLFNLFLSYVRPVVYRVMHGSMDKYRNVSGIPIISSLLSLLAAANMQSSVLYGWLLLTFFIVDPLGVFMAISFLLKEALCQFKNN